MAFRFAVQEHLVPGRSLEEKWGFAEAVGYGGLELRGAGEALRARLPELRAAARAGVTMPTVCVNSDRFIGDFDPGRRAEALRGMKTLLSIIAEVGGKGAITPASWGMHSNVLPPFRAPRSPGEDRAILIDMLGELGELAVREGVVVLFEPLNRYEDHMVNTLAQGVSICVEFGHGGVRLIADTYHMNIEEADIAGALRGAGGWVAHVHLSDSNRAEPGRGHVDFARIFEALAATGFGGYCAIECRLSQEPATALRAAFGVLAGAAARGRRREERP